MAELPENTVKYSLYSNSKETLDDQITIVYKLLGNYFKDYIWQNESFLLTPCYKPIEHLEGITNYEDNVEDEWFIIFLLFKLTSENHNFIVQIEDSDGDPLLIQAANYIPEWLIPENSVNRIFLYKGKIHCIPQSFVNPNLEESLETLRSGLLSTEFGSDVHNSINERISIFPEEIKNQKHKAKCYAPSSIFSLLKMEPGLISSAVRAFYLRDQIDIKVCRSMKYFPPESRILRNIKFTKVLYAQLRSQKFNPDVKVGWNLPPQNSPLFRSYDIGMKLACGFEILVSKASKSSSGIINAENCKEKTWLDMMKKLESIGYFENLLKESKDYKEKITNAFNFYRSCFPNDTNNLGDRILEMLKQTEVNYNNFKGTEVELSSEDSEEWLNIEEEQLDELLVNKFGQNLESNLSTTIPEALKSFINYGKSGIEGAEVPDTLNPVKFDVDKFSDNLHSILSLKMPQSDSDSSTSSAMSLYDKEDSSLNIDDENFDLSMLKPGSSKTVHDEKYIEDMKMYMKAMDKELSETEVGKSFKKNSIPPLATGESSDDSEFEDEQNDLNALENILESYESQNGLPGPASTMLNSMGIYLPKDFDTLKE